MKETWEDAKNTNLTDGVEISTFLKELIEKNLDGDISIEDMIKELVNYYESN